MRRALLLTVALIGCVRPAVGSRMLRVMTFNIEYGTAGLDTIAATIRASGADVVGLQEVDVHWNARSRFEDQATALAERTGMTVRFAPIYRLAPLHEGEPPREFGVALLTRFDVRAFRNDSITRLSTQDAAPVPTRMPGMVDATLDVRGTPVRVLVTHLDYRADPSVRRAQVAETLALLDATPTLLLGDLNASPEAPELAPLLARLHDAAPSGSSLTYPAVAPTKRIDYVLTSSRFRVRSATAVDARASDHRPVVATLVLDR